jgi:1,4-alpha-glucan branching enzyme
LPLSHDEVVYGKGSLVNKMPGDNWQKFANLRLLYGYMFTHPGKKLLFMGDEFGQWNEWNHEASLDWHLLQYKDHREMQGWVMQLNMLYRNEPALHEHDFSWDGFKWIDCNDWENSVISFMRKGKAESEAVIVVCNFTPVPRLNYKIGAPMAGFWKEILNSDAKEFGGSGCGNLGGVEAKDASSHGMSHSLIITVPPLAIVAFKSKL